MRESLGKPSWFADIRFAGRSAPDPAADNHYHHTRQLLLPAMVVGFSATLWLHSVVYAGLSTLLAHAPYVALDGLLAVPVVGAAIWAVHTHGHRFRLRRLGARAVAIAVAVTALSAPLAVLQAYGHKIVGSLGTVAGSGGGAAVGYGGAAVAGTGIPALAGHGLTVALAVWPAVLVTALLVEPLGRLLTDQRARRRSVARIRASRRPLTVASSATALVAGVGAVAFLPASPAVAQAGGCDSAPQRVYQVAAIDVEVTVNRFGDNDPFGYMYVLEDNLPALRAEEAALRRGGEIEIEDIAGDPTAAQVSPGLGKDLIQPLVLRARLGECVIIHLRNALQHAPVSGPNNNNMFQLPGGVPRVSIDLQGVSYNAHGGQGGQPVGQNGVVMAAPGQVVQYKFYLDPLMGEGTKVFRSGGESTQLTAHGLFGALVAEPANALWFDPQTGEDVTNDASWSNWEAMVNPRDGTPTFREFTILYHEIGDEDFNLRRPRREGSAAVPAFPEFGAVGNPLPMVDGGPNVNNPTGSGGSTAAYRPGSRAINYRSESFYRRMQLETVLVAEAGFDPDDPDDVARANAEAQQAQKDNKSLGYSSYTYGDPATPMPRSYLGEPSKTRLAHAGFEQLHVHHLHGGGTRWRQNPRADDPDIDGGLKKSPIQDAQSIRLDSQTVSPEEALTLEHECGAGGCQQAAGDFLYHCHIAHHYIAGMWGMWRVFDTRQPDLAPLPGRAAPPAAVNSAGLLGEKLADGRTVVLDSQVTDPDTQVGLETLVERQLPPQGVPLDRQDATVWDWLKTGPANAPVYVGEPETDLIWANYRSLTPGQRPQIMFNPVNGRPAYPLFSPHLKRPPFSPGEHSGAPWLGNTATEERPDGLCPDGADIREYDITAVTVALQMTGREVVPDGMLYVLNEDKQDLLDGDRATEPLVIRSNVGDCVALTFGNEIDSPDLAKANMHTHFVQFDPQASDGVITGFAYEQSVFPAHRDGKGTTLVQTNSFTSITVDDASRLRPGIAVAIGLGTPDIEIRTITGVSGDMLTLDRALDNSHPAGASVTVEFTQHRWFSDVDSGTVFWHDHVDGIVSWARGLFAAHIIEPPGSTYHDPQTGEEVNSGTIVDIRAPANASVGVGQSGSFREYMVFVHNGRPAASDVGLNPGQECEEASINLLAEPLGERTPPGTLIGDPASPTNVDPATTDQRFEYNGFNRCRNAFTRTGGPGPNDGTAVATVTTVDPYVFSSVTYGDPRTPLFRAYAGDDVVIRTIGIGERGEGLRIQGHRFRTERFNTDGRLVDSAITGISERFDYVLDGGAGGHGGKAGDFLYYSTRTFALESGAWGIFRVHDTAQGDLQPLPDNQPSNGSGFPVLSPHQASNPQQTPGGAPPSAFLANGDVDEQVVSDHTHACPSRAPTRTYQVTAFDHPLPTAPFPDQEGIVYALSADVAAVKSGQQGVEPLVLRVNQGECVIIELTNDIDPSSLYGGTRAGFDLGQLLRNPQLAAGSAVGLNPDTTVGTGDTIEYRFYADREVGTTIFQNLGSPASLRHGGYGLLIVEPAGSRWFDSYTGQELTGTRTSTEAVIRPAFGAAFREFAMTMQTTDQQYGRSIVNYIDVVAGNGINAPRSPANVPQPPVAGAPPGTENHVGSFDKAYNHVNYHSAPLTTRIGLTNAPGHDGNPGWWEPGFLVNEPYHSAFSSVVHSDPDTPVFRAHAGDRTVFRIGVGASDHLHSITVSGHMFPLEPGMWNGGNDRRSQLMVSRTITAGGTLDAWLVGGAGGPEHYPGDYVYRDSRQPWTAAGLWGILRVQVPGSGTITPL